MLKEKRNAKEFNTALVQQLAMDFGFWLALMFGLSAYRMLIIACWIRDVPIPEILLATAAGARFDAVLATLVVLPSLCLSPAFVWFDRAAWSARLRLTSATLLVGLSSLVYAIDFAFFGVFGNHLDQRVMALRNDTDHALLQTIWKAHAPLTHLCIGAIAGALVLFLGNWASTRLARTAGTRSTTRAWLVWAASLGCLVFCVRGFSLGRTPIRVRNAFVTTDPRLNRSIPSPYASLWHALEDRNAALGLVTQRQLEDALAAQGGAVGAASPTLDPAQRVAASLVRQANGTPRAPRHVFILVLEGQHGFPLLARYRSLALFPGLASLADEGATWPLFIPSGQATDSSLSALVAGVLSHHYNALHEERMLSPLPTAFAPHMERLGYRSRFFYGGYLGWSRLDLALPGQGFSEVFSAADARRAPGNEWGVWDEHLFGLVLDKVAPQTASFNVILTTTNHSPFDLDDASLPTLPTAARQWDSQTQRVLQHERYVDRVVTDFVRQADARFPQSLFVIVGDHAAHAAHPSGLTAFEAQTVPLIMFGSGLDSRFVGSSSRPASHLDIAPTLYELCAPSGFTYVSMGTNALSPLRPLAIGEGMLGSGSAVGDMTGDGALRQDPCCGESPGDLSAALRLHRAVTTTSRALLRGVTP